MAAPRAIVIRAAGINCEQEAKAACDKVGFQTDITHVNRLIENRKLVHDYQFLIVPGGFSFGDDLGAGRVLANELKAKLVPELREFIQAGKLMMGICNGFQVLTKAGLLPEPMKPSSAQATLGNNDSGKFEDRWIRLKVCSVKSEFLKKEEVIELPIAHGEGKFLPGDAESMNRWEQGGQLVLKYVGPEDQEAGYPWNPNGSVSSVAGICDPTGRVLGLMPHPERFQDATNHPRWTRRGGDIRPDGLKFFLNAFEYVKRNL